MKYHVLNITNMLSNQNMNNAIVGHSRSTGHRVNWEGFRVIGHEEPSVKRKELIRITSIRMKD